MQQTLRQACQNAYQVCQEFLDTDEVCPSGIYSVYPGAESACMAAGSLAGEASMPASSSGPSANAEDLYYDPAGGTESFPSTHSLGPLLHNVRRQLCKRSVCRQGELAAWSLVPPGLQSFLSGVPIVRCRCPELQRPWLLL